MRTIKFLEAIKHIVPTNQDIENAITALKTLKPMSCFKCQNWNLLEWEVNINERICNSLRIYTDKDFFCKNFISSEIETIEYEPITPKNLIKVLKYNRVNPLMYLVEDSQIVTTNHDGVRNIFLFKDDKWLEHLQLDIGELRLMPKNNLN